MRVGIVGAGITGLTVGHYLDQRTIEFEIFERASEPGGVIRSRRVDGKVLELGPQRTRLSGRLSDLLEDLSLTDEMIEGADVPLFVVRDGKLRRVPLSIGDAIRTDLLSPKAKARSLLEPFTARPQPGESVHGYFTRAFGEEVADYLAGPLYGGLYASDPRDMPVEHSLRRALDRYDISGSLLVYWLRSRLSGRSAPPVISFEGGLQTLPQRLADRLADSVAFDSEIVDIRHANDEFELIADGPAGRFDAVVLTVPAGVAGELLAGIDPATADALGRLSYNPLAVVNLEADTDLTGIGYQIPWDEPFETLGVTWNTSLLDRKGVYTCYLGGSYHPELLDRSNEDLERLAAEEFEAVTGATGQPLDIHRIRPGMPAYDRSWRYTERIDPPNGIQLCANYTDRAGLPGRVNAAHRLAADLATKS